MSKRTNPRALGRFDKLTAAATQTLTICSGSGSVGSEGNGDGDGDGGTLFIHHHQYLRQHASVSFGQYRRGVFHQLGKHLPVFSLARLFFVVET